MFFCLQPRVLLALLAQAVRGCDDKRSWRKGKRLKNFKRFPFFAGKKNPKNGGSHNYALTIDIDMDGEQSGT